MKKLIKQKETFLTDMLDGLLITHPELTVIADTVVVKKEKKTSGVAIVSGGGSGHEPAHAGYVAQGMLDAAVCGEVFTSPTPDKILEAIKYVNNDAGVLLVVKNYAGDVMNFEMAQEMADMEGINVEMVIVKDDIAVSNEEQRRGVAGTVLVHKYAGYLAEQGNTLEAIKEQLEVFIPTIKSLGMAISPPLVPTTGKYGFDIEDDQMEIGVGIHGEKGLHRTKMQDIESITQTLVSELLKEIKANDIIVMVNGMGGTPLSELNIATKFINNYLKGKDKAVAKWLVGDYMTSLDMQGFSITIVPNQPQYLEAFNAKTSSPYFH
ncbi:dihydroxyacetone kinase subunit DhaK [Staphylococcus simiae]|uniref:dihydroxyacetone kinase subunit DhaK n=1 Tax=Staphylococcus simiae TaxID=308354 RepID=UPI001A9754F1|nr:dihydroxyacetone kinase subunit DhaK [Staphylococcus simiae]MBO1198826.1 dihydroxyacetone kinase subunit DhaK [Staphylococcus simiae]MBO1201023.1 dihydroxyacetone kinase subunit DhaK [Staphylococcus simiae]MBO1203839.1 dihydroxyacetone kinase subunit DhaK [Staphylococcus simiae]MBO1211063.1 dihydroxyacetone kinase subunit DhaK [Staphylococcus simiae]MBO1229384.1 dihydroxyacetone kinase subunit DhaK [Staphylococcus simiae]